MIGLYRVYPGEARYSGLSFGLRSAPKIFSAVADALPWAMVCNGVQHALHDFLLAGSPGSFECEKAISIAYQWPWTRIRVQHTDASGS